MLDVTEFGKRGYLTEDFRLFHLRDSRAEELDFHYHEFDKIVFHLSGRVTYHLEGKRYFLKPYDILMVGHSLIHRPVIDPAEPYERMVLWMKEDYLGIRGGEDLRTCFRLSQERRVHLCRPRGEDRLRYRELFWRLKEAAETKGFGAALLAEAVGPQLTCVFVDHGLMRLGEGDEVEAAFSQWDISFVRCDAEELFLTKLAGVAEPEAKRKIIGEEFIRVFEAEAKKIGRVDYLAQGTIYPDVIESGAGDAAVIKSHHNVGGLPACVDFKEIVEPLRLLFKDEVRQLGRELALPEYLVGRQPFPGPGLAVRCIGKITKEKLDTLRLADFIFRDEIARAGLEKTMDQYFAVLTNMRSVGVQGDGRTYDYTLALRSVTTTDFMTADWTRIPYEVLDRVSVRIVNEVPHINRIVYDITSKPPATIEWE